MFFANGVWVLTAGLAALVELGSGADAEAAIVLGAVLLGNMAFIVLFAPFGAVRHVLPVVPIVVLLIAHSAWTRLAPAVMALTAGLGILLAISDAQFADVYRSSAARFANDFRRDGATVWYVGHWGWGWYAEKAGFRHYDPGISELHSGDILIRPTLVPDPAWGTAAHPPMEEIERRVIPVGPLTVLRTMTMTPRGGYYSIGLRALPWALSNQPLEEFVIYRVGAKR